LPLPRFQPQHYSAALLLGVASAVLALVLFGQLPGRGRWISELGNSAHGPAFAIVTLILIALLRRARGRNASILSDYSLAIAGALLLGALIELMQLATGRDASFSDLGRDTLGALAATGLFTLVDPRVRALPLHRPTRLIGSLVGVASTLILVAPLSITGAAYLQRHRSFPTLVDFSSPLSAYFLGVYSAVTVEREALPDALSGGREGSIGLHARLAGNKGWSIALWEPYPDWRGYQRLAFDLANPTEFPLLLQVRVRDRSQGNDRQMGYLGRIEIAPRSRATHVIALRDFTAAEGRAYVDPAVVRSIVLARNPSNRAREFYLIRIWLE
jgi:hypothetical protein